MTSQPLYSLGLRLDKIHDPREQQYAWATHAPAAPDFSKPVTLSQYAPGIFIQALNDCVANATMRGLMVAARADESIPNPPMLSRHALYRWAREIDGDPTSDAGTYGSSALDGALKHGGVPKEAVDPYPGDYTQPVTATALADAANQAWLASHAPVYHTDQGGMVAGAVSALQAGRPVVIGMYWYSQFDTPAAGGVISLPINSQLRGGHELEIEDFEPAAPGKEVMFRVANSWGTGWGDGGYLRIPASLLDSQVVMDMRVIVPQAPAPKPAPTPTPTHFIPDLTKPEGPLVAALLADPTSGPRLAGTKGLLDWFMNGNLHDAALLQGMLDGQWGQYLRAVGAA